MYTTLTLGFSFNLGVERMEYNTDSASISNYKIQ